MPKVKKVREPKPKGKMSAYNLYMAQNFSKQDPAVRPRLILSFLEVAVGDRTACDRDCVQE